MPAFLYAACLLLSAFLMFWVELFFARLLLPLLGGSPAVWNTCLFFFQGTLLLGYGYAHLGARLGSRRQLLLHGLVLLVPLAFLPVALPAGWEAPLDDTAIPWLLGLLVVSLGAPFFVVSTSAPLLQSWYARLGRADSADPYPLYAASNLGSLLALLGYPLLLEPSLSLGRQSQLWGWGYGLLVVLTGAAGVLLWRRPPASGSESPEETPPGPPPGGAQRLRWVVLSFVPGALLYGVTTELTTDIAALPLLWVIPLGLYLLSFVLAFARRHWVPRHLLTALVAPLLIALLLAAIIPHALTWLLGIHLVGFFGAAYLLHRDLAAAAPPARYLTGYYLWIALGGLLAGLYCALAAPLLFREVLEYPLMLLAAALLLPADPREDDERGALWAVGLVLALLPATALLLGLRFSLAGLGAQLPVYLLTVPLLLALGLAFPGGWLRAGLGLLLMVLIGQCSQSSHLLHVERSFFGVHRVLEDEGLRHYRSGTTVHGRQFVDPERRRWPLAYYDPSGPIGKGVGGWAQRAGPGARAAVLGLGVAGLAAYGREGQHWRFYEIDPAVVRIARDSGHFTYLADTPAAWDIALGDARKCLEREEQAGEAPFDLLVLDVFSSDSVPAHLLTEEAFALYLRRLAPGGLIVANISSRYLDPEPLFASAADRFALAGWAQRDLNITPEQEARGKAASHCVVLARRGEQPGWVPETGGWRPLSESPRTELWTDDHADLLSILELR